jgi:hypothetical protein
MLSSKNRSALRANKLSVSVRLFAIAVSAFTSVQQALWLRIASQNSITPSHRSGWFAILLITCWNSHIVCGGLIEMYLLSTACTTRSLGMRTRNDYFRGDCLYSRAMNGLRRRMHRRRTWLLAGEHTKTPK